jgi:electron transport complex protein RnfG
MPDEVAVKDVAGPASIKPVLIVPVVIITMVAGAALALVNAVTEAPIAESRKREKSTALSEVMPSFANDPASEILPAPAEGEDGSSKLDPGQVRFYVGRDDGGAATGYGIESATDRCYESGKGLSLVFGIDPGGHITGIRMLSISETPGLGTKAKEPEFLDQFQGKGLDNFNFKVGKDGGDVDALTGATITSRGVSLCLDQGLRQYDTTVKGAATRSTPTAATPRKPPPPVVEPEAGQSVVLERPMLEKLDKEGQDDGQ